jgi:two-component system response regulator FixJ
VRVTATTVIRDPRPAVILVDDDPAVTHAMQFSFDLEGLDVRSFRDGESLLAVDDLPEKGCLILDHNLPGMDGIALLDRLRATGIRLPAILITTNPRAALRNRAAAAGVPIIEKPLLTDALLTAVRTALARQD